MQGAVESLNVILDELEDIDNLQRMEKQVIVEAEEKVLEVIL